MAHEVVACGEGGGDGGFPVEVLEDEGGAPVAAGEGGSGHALLVDLCTYASAFLMLFFLLLVFLWARRWRKGKTYLEPLLSTSITRLEVAGALVHPDHNRALLVGPLLPDCADLAAGFDLCDEVGGCAAVAHDFRVCDAHGGVVVGPLALDGFRGGGGGEAFVARVGGGWVSFVMEEV